jgi:hypothetical protein
MGTFKTAELESPFIPEGVTVEFAGQVGFYPRFKREVLIKSGCENCQLGCTRFQRVDVF